MESKWLEDFVVLSSSGSFSKAATLRHVTQPALSRRIRALEAWLGSDLIDRTTYPVRLTEAGVVFQKEALDMLAHLRKVRMQVDDSQSRDEVIDFALPHNLSLTFFPEWIRSLSKHLGLIRTRVRADNVLGAVSNLTGDCCDVLICYHHPLHPIELDVSLYDVVVLGQERVRLYVNAQALREELISWPGTVDRPVPMLSYSREAYLSLISSILLQQCNPLPLTRTVFETDMAEGIKAMALAGHGVACLPESTVRRECQLGHFIALDEASECVEIRAYRSKLGRRSSSSAADRLWEQLSQESRVNV
jgi:LysR family transcriptional regulator, hypochlorite-specific transcription factor HypT